MHGLVVCRNGRAHLQSLRTADAQHWWAGAHSAQPRRGEARSGVMATCVQLLVRCTGEGQGLEERNPWREEASTGVLMGGQRHA